MSRAGKKASKKTVTLDAFLGESDSVQKGFEKKNVNWAHIMENEGNDGFGKVSPPTSSNTVILPTAPKALRSNEIDTSKVPNAPPFKAYIGNIPYDADEAALQYFFSGLRVKNINLPREDKGSGKTRGFGYAEFDDRESLIDALRKHGESFNGRTLRVSLPEESGKEERRTGGFGGPGGGLGDEDRTLRDWRSGPKPDFAPAAPSGSWRSERTSEPSGYSSSRVSSIRDGGFRNGYNSESRYDSYAPPPSRYEERRFDDRRPGGGGGGFDRVSRSGGFDSYDRFDDRRDRERDFELSRDIMRPLPAQPTRAPPSFSRDDLPPRPQGNDDYDRRERVAEHRPLQRQYSGPSSERSERSERSEGRNRSDSDNSQSGLPPPPQQQHNVSPPQPEAPKQRPKLNLQKRTVPLEEVAAPAPVRSSIFGDAKPVDTTKREKEIEEKLKTLEVSDEASSSKDEKDGVVNSSGGRTRKISSSSSHSHSARSRKESETDSRHEDHNFQESSFHTKRGHRPFEQNRRPGGPNSHLPSGPRGGDRGERRAERRPDDREHFGRRDDRDNRDNRRPIAGDHRSSGHSSDHRRREGTDRERERRPAVERPPRESNNSRNDNRKDPDYTVSNKFGCLDDEDSNEQYANQD